MNKLIKFLKKNKYEKATSICRNVYSYLHKGKFASIGRKSYFIKPIYLAGTKYISMGEKVGIWHNARVEVIDEWKKQHFNPQLIIGDNVNIGQNLHLTCAESVIIEKDVVCSARVTILDNSHVTDDKTLAVLEQNLVTKPVKICQGAFIGINSTILPGVTIGKHAVVGANSVVTRDVPDFATVAGSPARVIKHGGI